eukprot:Stramenopile-MAST_4_protein_3216
MTSIASSGATPVDLDGLRASIAKQGATVRELKKSGGDGLAEAINLLKDLKLSLATAAKDQGSDIGQTLNVDRDALDTCLVRRMFVVPSFEIYGGVRGFYDFGPPGCAMKANLIKLWRQHFVLEENMQEVEATNLMPQAVLKTSGHEERFIDLMVKDTETGECFRADKLLEAHVERTLQDGASRTQDEIKKLEMHARLAESYSPAEMDSVLKELGVLSQVGNPLSNAFPFNLMFKSTIGPEGNSVGYLRPETAQGIFINFNRLLDCNYGKMPFAAAQIGQAFRNEIAPRNGLLRVREFCQAEIEHFYHPKMHTHPKFVGVAANKLILFPKSNQLGSGKTISDLTLAEAMDRGFFLNQTLAYYMARTAQFLIRVGIKPEYLRFRQHLDTEMAHYATDCWDAEILTSYGWTECVGHADRSCYDLKVHSDVTKKKMLATYVYPEGPRDVEVLTCKMVKRELGKGLGKQSKLAMEALETLSADEVAALAFDAKLSETGEAEIATSGGPLVIKRSMVSFEKVKKRVSEEKYLPSVIEPSFGIGRILYAVMEQAFATGVGGDAARTVFRFNPEIAPIKCAVLPLSGSKVFRTTVVRLSRDLTALSVENKVDESSTAIGRRYARMDEVGVPFALTVDFNTVGFEKQQKDGCVTLRERDGCKQIRIPVERAAALVDDLIKGRVTFSDLISLYGEAGGAPPLAVLCGGDADVMGPKNVVVQSGRSDGKGLLFSRPAGLSV